MPLKPLASPFDGPGMPGQLLTVGEGACGNPPVSIGLQVGAKRVLVLLRLRWRVALSHALGIAPRGGLYRAVHLLDNLVAGGGNSSTDYTVHAWCTNRACTGKKRSDRLTSGLCCALIVCI